MPAQRDGIAITSGSDYTFDADMENDDFKKLSYHSVSISGTGSATVEAVFPSGDKSAGSIASGGDDVFYYPGVNGIKVTAVSNDITVDFYSYEEIR